VVTGTAGAGEVQTGDTLLMLPQGEPVRVRGLRAHNEDADRATAGQRVALNLSGRIEKSDIDRGDWLVDPACKLLSNRLDVSFSLLDSAPFTLKHLSPVKLHIGARRTAGRLALIDPDQRRVKPGTTCTAQLILDEPVSATHGERYLLRDQAETVILGGGRVLDPQGPQYGKSRPGRLTWLTAMTFPTDDEALAYLLDRGELVDLNHFWTIRNQPEIPERASLPANATMFDYEDTRWVTTQARWSQAREALLDTINEWHKTHQELPGIKMTELKPLMVRTMEAALVMGVLVASLKSGDLLLKEGRISAAGFTVKVSEQSTRQWQAVRSHLERCQLKIPLVSELSEAVQIPENELRQLIKTAVKTGKLYRVHENRVALGEQLRQYCDRVIEAERNGDELTVVTMKGYFGSGRKLTIELLEFFDSIHFTRREGDRRVVINSDAALDRFS